MIQRISQVSGVSDVSVAGADQPAIRVTADPARLSAMGLGQDDVRTAIVNANALSPTGAIDGQVYGRAIATDDQLKTIDDYRNLVVKNASGRSVILSDVAKVVNGTRNARSEATFNGKPAVLIYIRKQASANVIKTVDRVKALIPEIKRFMPAGVEVSILNDRTTSIRASVERHAGHARRHDRARHDGRARLPAPAHADGCGRRHRAARARRHLRAACMPSASRSTTSR